MLDNGRFTDGDQIEIQIIPKQPYNLSIDLADRQPFPLPRPVQAVVTLPASGLELPMPGFENTVVIKPIHYGAVYDAATLGVSIFNADDSTRARDNNDLNTLGDRFPFLNFPFLRSSGLAATYQFDFECRDFKPNTGSNSGILQKALEDHFGEHLPCGARAHHIVAIGHQYIGAQISRGILEEYGVSDLNIWENGVVLPADQDSSYRIPGFTHNTGRAYPSLP